MEKMASPCSGRQRMPAAGAGSQAGVPACASGAALTLSLTPRAPQGK